MKRFLASALLACLLAFGVGGSQAIAAATILPPGETCFQGNTGTTGMVGLLGTITAGSGGTTGTYGGIALTGGSGSGATANITIAGGVVTAVTILNPGTAYVVGDTLSAAAANIGNTTGFSVPVSSVTINSALAGGSVSWYIPNTGTPKQTWQDAAQTILNTNPTSLDSNGCLVAYGTGSYRMVVKDSLGNTVYDKLTTDTSANNNTFWAGTSAGTPNVITVVDPGFNGTDGSIIQFVANQTNTGSATLNPSGFGAILIVKDTTAGAVALTGGEITQGNVIDIVYNSGTGSFHLLNTVIASASGAAAPLCGASGLVITNGATPNTIINMTAGSMVMVSNSGQVINRGSVSLPSINITTGNVTAAANGMDGEAPGTSQWLYIWGIDNGSAAAGLVSTSTTAPTMPSGYTYKCRLGAVKVDGASLLLRTIQRGNTAQYVATAGSNTTAPPVLVTGIAGSTFSTTNPVLVTASVGGVVPATAVGIFINATNNWTGLALSSVLIAPNQAYSGVGNGPIGVNGVTFPIYLNGPGAGIASASAYITLETTTLSWASSGAGGAMAVSGWKDSVNAN